MRWLATWEGLSQSRGKRAVLALCTLLGLLLFLLAVQHHLSPPATTDDSGQFVPQTASTPLSDGASQPRERRVVLFIIDSLSPRVVESPRLRFLEAYRQHGFRAEIEPCVDRLTIPCLRDAFTGVSSFGLFGAFDNLVSAQQLDTSNLFRDLQEAGKRVGGVAHGELDQFAGSLDRYVRKGGVRDEIAAVLQMVNEGFDLVIYHYIWLDLVTHRAPFESEPYQRALAEVDAIGTGLLQALPPGYELVVLGDHGHDEKGRHIQGLDVPTEFLSSGSTWGNRRVTERLPITTYRFLLGAKLGVLPPPQYEGTNVAAWLDSNSTLGDAARQLNFQTQDRKGGFPWLPLGAALLPAAAIWAAAPPSRRTRWIVAGGLLLAFVSGCLYPTLVRTLHFNLDLPDFSKMLPFGILIVGGLAAVLTRSASLGFWTLGVVFVALPQTLYRYGLYQRVIPLALVAGLLIVLETWRRKAKGPVGTSSLLRLGAIALGLVALYQVLAPVYVMNFVIRNFSGIARLPPTLFFGLPIVWGALVGWVTPGKLQRRIAMGLVGAVGFTAVLQTGLGPWVAAVLILGCGMAYWLASPLPLFLAAALLTPYFFDPVPVFGIAFVILFWVLAGRLAVHGPKRYAWVLGGVLAGLSYYALAYSSGLRANGLDYQFALAWLPGRMAEDHWYVIAAAMLIKVLLPVGLLSHAAHKVGPWLRRPAVFLAYLRAAAAPLFISGFLLTVDELPRFRLLEICEDLIVWWFVATVLAFVPLQFAVEPPDSRVEETP